MPDTSESPIGRLSDDLVQRFPGRRHELEVEFQHSESFRTLCEDWWICAKAMSSWNSSTAANADQRTREYEEWLTELEREIEVWLDRS